MNIAGVTQAAAQAATSGAGTQSIQANNPVTAKQISRATQANLAVTGGATSEEKGPQEAGETTEAGEAGGSQAAGKVNAYA
jgi:guanyl-specific ribonuclease Sa